MTCYRVTIRLEPEPGDIPDDVARWLERLVDELAFRGMSYPDGGGSAQHARVAFTLCERDVPSAFRVAAAELLGAAMAVREDELATSEEKR